MKFFNAATLLILTTLESQGTAALVTGIIKIVGEPGGVTQFLPGSYVNTFPRWTAECTEERTVNLSRMLGSGLDRSEESSTVTLAHQFVDPTSNEELWWPSDLKTLQARPTLDILIKSGFPAYVMAGLEVRVPSDKSMDGREWRNFGMNCQPLASQWTAFNLAHENGFRVEAFYGRALIKNESEEKDTIDWKAMTFDTVEESCKEKELPVPVPVPVTVPLLEKEERKMVSAQRTQNALEILGGLLASMDEQSPLADGMHIVSIPVNEWTDLPSIDGEDDTYQLVSVGTVESDAKELLNMDDDLIAMSATSLLNVEVKSIAPGGESEWIPAVYAPLYKR